MNAPALFALAILLPILLAAVLLVPPYLGMYAAAYIVYMPAEGVHPLASRYADVIFVVNTYDQLLAYWASHMFELSFFGHALPIVFLPILCTGFSVWATIRLSRKFLNVFYDFAAGGQ